MKYKKILLVLLLLLAVQFVSAGEERISIYILNLGKFDVGTGAFTADFYLSIVCEDNCSTDFEFMNGRAAQLI